MAERNVTVTLPADIIREAKHLAVDGGVSLSRFVAMLVEERVRATREFRREREEHVRLLEQGFNLGTNGNTPWTRDDLHQR
jgi:hypothetical protein